MLSITDYILIIASLIIIALLTYIIISNRKQESDTNFDEVFNKNFDKINNSLEQSFLA